MREPKSSSLLFDKGLDLVLMFLGLYAAMAVQDFVDHGKDRSQYIKLLEGFQEELESNKAQRTNIESKLGSLDQRNSIGEADKSFIFFGKQTKYMDQFVRCYTDILLNKAKQAKVSPARLKSCFTFLKAKFKLKQPEHLDLSPVYRRDVWRLYLAGGVQLFREFESESVYDRCQIEGKSSKRLAICIGSIYSELSDVEGQVHTIQELVNETYFFRQGVIDAEFGRFKRKVKELKSRKDADAAKQLRELRDRLIHNFQEGQEALDISRTQLRYKIRQLKDTTLKLEKRIDAVLNSIRNEVM
jgi:hypothetical protein